MQRAIEGQKNSSESSILSLNPHPSSYKGTKDDLPLLTSFEAGYYQNGKVDNLQESGIGDR